jgi:5-methyltetrahydrofolate--homocysteine methyltransferase
MTTLNGTRTSVTFGPEQPLLLINDQLRVYDQDPSVVAALRQGDPTPFVTLALAGAAAGCAAVDILLDHPELDERETLPLVLRAVDDALGCPILLDTRNAGAIEAALDGYTGKALLNSVVLEKSILNSLLPLARKHGMAVIAMLVDDVHIPETWQGRMAIAHRILQATDEAGIRREDVVLDCVCLASAAVPGSMQVTLDTLRAVHEELGMSTLLGIGNAGFGMPDPTRLDLLYLAMAASWGLDAALVDYHTEYLAFYAHGIDFLTGRDAFGQGYLDCVRRHAGQHDRPLSGGGNVQA